MQRVPDVLFVLIHRNDDHPRLRRDGQNERRRFDAVHPRHGDVHQNDVGMVKDDGGERLVAVRGLDDIGDLRHFRDESAQAAAHQGVVISEKESHG